MSLARRSAAALIMEATSITAGVVLDFCISSDCISRMASTFRSCGLEEMNSISPCSGESTISFFETQLVQKAQILRFGHHHDQFVADGFQRKSTATAGHRGAD